MSTVCHVLSVFPYDYISIYGKKERGRERKVGSSVPRIRMRINVCMCMHVYARYVLGTCY